jgi:hypothetical protein
MRVSGAALLALMLLGGSGEAMAQATDGCVAPPVWSASAARPGHPDEEISACLRSEAYKARTLHIPVASVANGIAASCEVEVQRIEGALTYDNAALPEARRQALERDAMRQATAAVTRYRSCAAR